MHPTLAWEDTCSEPPPQRGAVVVARSGSATIALAPLRQETIQHCQHRLAPVRLCRLTTRRRSCKGLGHCATIVANTDWGVSPQTTQLPLRTNCLKSRTSSHASPSRHFDPTPETCLPAFSAQASRTLAGMRQALELLSQSMLSTWALADLGRHETGPEVAWWCRFGTVRIPEDFQDESFN